MKIAILPVNSQFQPQKAIHVYPSHSRDYGVEQDFLIWLKNHPDILTDDFKNADWHYLPIFWTRWYFNNVLGKEGKVDLKAECDRVIIDDKKTFTICQSAGGAKVDIGKTIQFQSSPLVQTPFLIPELSLHPGLPLIKPRKKYCASFVGRISTHPARTEFKNYLEKDPGVYFYDGKKGIHFYTRTMLKSYISLCPRGAGMGSFRLYESLFAGVTPLVFGDFDSRPFRKWINWNNFSFFTSDLEECLQIIRNTAPETLIGMGKIAKLEYSMHIDFQKWCKFILMDLEELHSTNTKNSRQVSYPYIGYYHQQWLGIAPKKLNQFSLLARNIRKFLYKHYKRSGIRGLIKGKNI